MSEKPLQCKDCEFFDADEHELVGFYHCDKIHPAYPTKEKCGDFNPKPIFVPLIFEKKEIGKIDVSEPFIEKTRRVIPTEPITPNINKIWNYNRFDKNFVVGNLVKLSFNTPTGRESMWVIIIEAKGYQPRTEWTNKKGFHEETFNTEFVGTLDNQPLDDTEIKYGDKIKFSLEHIIRMFDMK